MQVLVRFFAGHRDIVGKAEQRFELADGATVGTLWEQLVESYPRLKGFQGRLLYAVNEEFSSLDTELHDGDEVAYIPPVSGGSELPLFRVTPEAIEPAPLVKLVQTPADGAVVTFAGVGRDNFAGRASQRLSYEAYVPLAERALEQIANEARERWEIGKVAIHHRIGTIEIGETAVLVVVAAPHRQAAFAAAEYIMDRIKEIVPIWKREHWADGSEEWIGDEKTRKNHA
jgi:molybdopterin converting factor subunit 1